MTGSRMAFHVVRRYDLAVQCPACHTDNREGRRFCTKCGVPLAVACAACGFANDPTDQFCGGCGASLLPPPPSQAPSKFASPDAYTPRHLAEKILTSKASLEGERKQVTVLFVDVSGFTAISERLDPEDVHGFMRRAFELMLAEVHRYEGTVNQFLGDGIMALFGAPVAHEDHARRLSQQGPRVEAAGVPLLQPGRLRRPTGVHRNPSADQIQVG